VGRLARNSGWRVRVNRKVATTAAENNKQGDVQAWSLAFAPAILSVAGKIHPEFLRLLWVLADMQTVKYFNLVEDEEDIGNERFKWSRASTSAIIGMRLVLPLHTLQPYELICRYMAPLTL